MDLQKIIDKNDYNTCIKDADMIESSDKILFCPNFYYVFYGELELNLNRYFIENACEEWSLLFVDYNFMPPVYINDYTSFEIFEYEPNILTILHNAKIKYCCLHCQNEWTTARGRAIFQAEIPETNKYNILFVHLFTQKCEICYRNIEPSWYLDEVTRVMKNVSRILIDIFYSKRPFFSKLSSQHDDKQRISYMKHHHQRDLCKACEQGSCFSSLHQ